jgi:putative transposase
MSEMHLLPGTTFSNVPERGDYDSDAAAVMTLDEFETWIWRFIACDYNRRFHSSLSAPPAFELLRLMSLPGRPALEPT